MVVDDQDRFRCLVTPCVIAIEALEEALIPFGRRNECAGRARFQQRGYEQPEIAGVWGSIAVLAGSSWSVRSSFHHPRESEEEQIRQPGRHCECTCQPIGELSWIAFDDPVRPKGSAARKVYDKKVG